MSTLVVARKGRTVTMAGDTLTVFGDLRMAAPYRAGTDKILRVQGACVGVIGFSAHRLVVESVLAQEASNLDLSSAPAIFESLRRLHPLLKEHYYLIPAGEAGDPYESSQMSLLIASPKGIFGVLALREVFEYERFWALGSGQEYALGAMHALYDSAPDSERLARAGVEAGCEFDTSSAPPITFHTLTLE